MWTFLFLFFVLVVGLSFWEYAGRHLIRGVGTPSYMVLERYKEYEIREYEPFVSAEVSVSGTTEAAMNEGFSILSSYLSRLEGDDAPIPKAVSGIGAHTVAFALPARYAGGDLPEPDDPRITFRVVPGRIAAVLRFRGIPSERRIVAKTKLLRKLLRRDCHEPLSEVSEPEIALLAPPHSMPIAATNEIIIDIEG
jgi:hypothetical protein